MRGSPTRTRDLLQIVSSDAPSESATLSGAVAAQSDKELKILFSRSQAAFEEIYSRHLDRWVVTFSGGKDSTLCAILAAEYLAGVDEPPRLDVVYADTMLEVPAMRCAASKMLDRLATFGKEHDVDLRTHIVRAGVNERYWVKLIGRGYPPPKPKFRWCTRRLKIEPAARYVDNGRPTAVLTGVRYGESAGRTARLVSSCTNGGECGQDYWAQRGPQGTRITYFAPIVEWRTCKVWDFLHFIAPQVGWPTEDVFALYGDTSLRFGCWTCTLVRRDRTMEALVARDPGSSLAQMNEFRDWLLAESSKSRNRWYRTRGGVRYKGPLSLSFRMEVLSRLRRLEHDTRRNLLTDAEERVIRATWQGLPARSRRCLTASTGSLQSLRPREHSSPPIEP